MSRREPRLPTCSSDTKLCAIFAQAHVGFATPPKYRVHGLCRREGTCTHRSVMLGYNARPQQCSLSTHRDPALRRGPRLAPTAAPSSSSSQPQAGALESAGTTVLPRFAISVMYLSRHTRMENHNAAIGPAWAMWVVRSTLPQHMKKSHEVRPSVMMVRRERERLSARQPW
jgi:hypothetical protein